MLPRLQFSLAASRDFGRAGTFLAELVHCPSCCESAWRALRCQTHFHFTLPSPKALTDLFAPAQDGTTVSSTTIRYGRTEFKLDVRVAAGETNHKRLAQLFRIPAKRLLLVCRGRNLKTEEEVTQAAMAGATIVLLGTVAEKQARAGRDALALSRHRLATVTMQACRGSLLAVLSASSIWRHCADS